VYKNKKFENLVLFMIILSSVSLVIGTYNNYQFMQYLDFIITGFFILECVIKIIT
jgi:hypothetical protein